MAKTAYATSNALAKKAWEEALFRDSKKESYFAKFMGESSDSLVQTDRNLSKTQGDKVTFGIRQRLVGAGVTSGQMLEGNEERLVTYDYSVTLEQYRHAVRDNGKMDRKRVMFSIDTESKAALKDWGSEKIDQLCFDALGVGDGSVAGDEPSKIFYLNSSGVLTAGTVAATVKAALHATNSKLTLDMITGIKTWAVTGGDRAQTPLRPVKVKGKKYYILLVHPDCLYDLRVSSDFKQAMREAQERGDENPLFQDAVAIWSGVVIHAHENVNIFTDGGGAAVAGAKCVFMGAQSLVWANGENEEVTQKKFDYDNENGFSWGLIAKAGRPVFNSKTYGSVGVYLSRTNIAGL